MVQWFESDDQLATMVAFIRDTTLSMYDTVHWFVAKASSMGRNQ